MDVWNQRKWNNSNKQRSKHRQHEWRHHNKITSHFPSPHRPSTSLSLFIYLSVSLSLPLTPAPAPFYRTRTTRQYIGPETCIKEKYFYVKRREENNNSKCLNKNKNIYGTLFDRDSRREQPSRIVYEHDSLRERECTFDTGVYIIPAGIFNRRQECPQSTICCAWFNIKHCMYIQRILPEGGCYRKIGERFCTVYTVLYTFLQHKIVAYRFW